MIFFVHCNFWFFKLGSFALSNVLFLPLQSTSPSTYPIINFMKYNIMTKLCQLQKDLPSLIWGALCMKESAWGALVCHTFTLFDFFIICTIKSPPHFIFWKFNSLMKLKYFDSFNLGTRQVRMSLAYSYAFCITKVLLLYSVSGMRLFISPGT